VHIVLSKETHVKKTEKRAPRKGTTAIVKKETLPVKAAEGVRAITAVDPQALLAQAIDKGMPVESMERLLAMRREMKEEWAREQFFKALAGFQKECPIIGKDRVAKIRSKKGDESSFSYRYAPLETITATAQPFLEKWGFSWTCKPSQTETHVNAAVHAHHVDGHEEVTKFEVPLDPSSYMSEPQKAAAASTFARRYAFINAFGITTKGEDNDAQPGEEEPRKARRPIQPPQEKKADAAIPTTHEEVKPLDDYAKIINLLKSVSTAPGGQVVAIFNEGEKIDYTHEANEAKNNPEELKRILSDIVQTGAKRHKAIKGEK
jgi:hypothetical protein